MIDLNRAYKNEQRKKLLLISAVALVMLMAGYVFTTIGMKNIAPTQTLIAITKAFNGTLDSGADAATNKVIMLLRLPRIILAMLAGIGLAVSGAVMQSLTRNYLVSPFFSSSFRCFYEYSFWGGDVFSKRDWNDKLRVCCSLSLWLYSIRNITVCWVKSKLDSACWYSA